MIKKKAKKKMKRYGKKEKKEKKQKETAWKGSILQPDKKNSSPTQKTSCILTQRTSRVAAMSPMSPDNHVTQRKRIA